MTNEEMLAKISAKTEEYNTEKENAQKATASRIQSLVDKVKASLPKLRDTHETLVARNISIEWERSLNSSVPNTDNMDSFKEGDDGIIDMNACDPEFGLYYRYKEGSHPPTMAKLYINFVKEEICSCYDGLHTTIPINEVSINTMFPRLDLYHYQVLLEKFEKLVNGIDPYVERVARFVEAY